MKTIILAAALIADGASVAAAQSSPNTTNPFTTKPASNSTMPNGEPKWMPPPAARSGDKGLSFGDGAATGEIQVKRKP